MKERNLKVTDVEIDKTTSNSIQKDLLNGGDGSKFDIDKKGTPLEGIDQVMRDTMDEMESHFKPSEATYKLLQNCGIDKKYTEEFVRKVKNTTPGYIFDFKGLDFIRPVTNQVLLVPHYITALEKAVLNFSNELTVLKSYGFFKHIKQAFKTLRRNK